MASLRIGPVGVEDSWRPADLATLPRIAPDRGSTLVAALDEVLSVLSEEGDRLITAFDLPPAFVEAMGAAGFPVDPVPSAESGPDVLGRTLAHADTLRPEVAGMTLEPYAARPEYESIASALDLAYDAPTTACATLVNSKTWSNEVVRGYGWHGAAARVTSIVELERSVSATRSAVLLKDPYGVSGQGTLAIRSETAYRSVARHLERQVERGMRLELLVQPLFEKHQDISTHWHISPDGSILAMGCLENDVDGFRYRGSAALDPATLRRADFEHLESAGTTVCEELFKAGYFGPVDIDGLITSDGAVVPCLEVNARVSMGTIALALMRHAAQRNLHATLEFINVRADAEAPDLASFLSELAEAGVLYTGDRPGVLPITANTFRRGERGRLITGSFHPPGDAGGVLREALGIASSCGIHPEDSRYS